MIGWNDVVALAPELAEIDPAAQEFILSHVNNTLNASLLGGEGSPKLRLARMYLAAHYGVMNGKSAAGPVTLEMEGPVMRQFAAWQGAEVLRETGYGRAFSTLVRGSAARAPWVL